MIYLSFKKTTNWTIDWHGFSNIIRRIETIFVNIATFLLTFLFPKKTLVVPKTVLEYFHSKMYQSVENILIGNPNTPADVPNYHVGSTPRYSPWHRYCKEIKRWAVLNIRYFYKNGVFFASAVCVINHRYTNDTTYVIYLLPWPTNSACRSVSRDEYLMKGELWNADCNEIFPQFICKNGMLGHT